MASRNFSKDRTDKLSQQLMKLFALAFLLLTTQACAWHSVKLSAYKPTEIKPAEIPALGPLIPRIILEDIPKTEHSSYIIKNLTASLKSVDNLNIIDKKYLEFNQQEIIDYKLILNSIQTNAVNQGAGCLIEQMLNFELSDYSANDLKLYPLKVSHSELLKTNCDQTNFESSLSLSNKLAQIFLELLKPREAISAKASTKNNQNLYLVKLKANHPYQRNQDLSILQFEYSQDELKIVKIGVGRVTQVITNEYLLISSSAEASKGNFVELN